MASSSRRWVALCAGGALIVAAELLGFLLACRGAAPAPLGTALPEVPRIFEVEGVKAQDTSLVEGRVPEVWLEFLAPQPDGVPPLRYPYNSDAADFSIRHPMGTETAAFGVDDVLEDAVLAQAVVKLDQPLIAIKYSIPSRRSGESLTEYTARLRHEMEQKDAVFYPDHTPLLLPAYRFEHLEYKRDAGEQGVLSHYIYIGPFGERVLVIDFAATPELFERARPYVAKIMGSFVPGWDLKKLMLMEDPDYGECAGTPLAADPQ